MEVVKVLLERFPYRYVENGTLDNGFPDYRIQKQMNTLNDIVTCIFLIIKSVTDRVDDFEYTKWLDPEGVPCYIKDSVKR